NVPNVRPRSADRVLRSIADAEVCPRRRLYHIRVEVPGDGALALRQVRVAGEDDAAINPRASAADDIGARSERVADTERLAADERGDTGDIPVVEDPSDNRVRKRGAELRNVVGVVEHEVVRAVEVPFAVVPHA